MRQSAEFGARGELFLLAEPMPWRIPSVVKTTNRLAIDDRRLEMVLMATRSKDASANAWLVGASLVLLLHSVWGSGSSGGEKLEAVPTFNLAHHHDEYSRSGGERRLLQSEGAAATSNKQRVEAYNAIKDSFPCPQGCSGHGKCSTLVVLKGFPPPQYNTSHGRHHVFVPALSPKPAY